MGERQPTEVNEVSCPDSNEGLEVAFRDEINPTRSVDSTRSYGDSGIINSFQNLYRSVFASSPALQNDQVFSEVSRMLLSPDWNLDSLRVGMNQILDHKGLPGIKIGIMDPMIANKPISLCSNSRTSENILGFYQTGTGQLRISEDLLKSHNAFRVGDIILHETNHFEQDVLITRAIMDDVAKENPSNFLEAVSSRYKERVGKTPTAAFLNSVAKVRNGEELSFAERSRAEILLQSYAELPIQGPQKKEAASQRDILQSYICMLDNSLDPASASDRKISPAQLIDKLVSLAQAMQHSSFSRDERNARIFFGDDKRTTEEETTQRITQILNRFGEPGARAFSESRARLELAKFLQERMQALTAEFKSNYSTYRESFHETESFAVGAAFVKYLQNKLQNLRRS